jgi:hypothetical protein
MRADLLLASSLLGALASLSSAQTAATCSVNLVPNGNFEAAFPPWTIIGPASATTSSGNTTGTGQISSCLRLDGATMQFTVSQPTAFALQARTYEFSMDLLNSRGWRMSLDAGIVNGATRTQIGTEVVPRQGSLDTHKRFTFLFTAPQAGNYTLDMVISFETTSFVCIDNVSIRPVDGFVFNFPSSPRRTGIANTYRIDGAPNQTVAVMLAPFALVPGVPIPGICSGELQIGPLNTLFTFRVHSLGASGTFSGMVTMPASVAAFPIWWQPIALTPGCAIGCASSIAFP